MDNYQNTIRINVAADKIFDALTNDIPQWWTAMFIGRADQERDIFTVRFGDHVFKTMQVSVLVDNTNVVWEVKDSLIDIPDLKNKTEWIGTTISWQLNAKEHFTELQLTHIGLHPAIECYNICSSGWQTFIESLKSYLEVGTGKPYLQESDN